MSPLDIVVLVLLIVAIGLLVRQRVRRGRPLDPAPRRILFPFIGSNLSQLALDAALRLCRAEHATLVLAALARVPLSLPLEAPQPRQAATAMPVLDAVEQCASTTASWSSPDHRARPDHSAMPSASWPPTSAATWTSSPTARTAVGLALTTSPWLLDELPGEIVVLRPERPVRGPGTRPRGRSAAGRLARRRQAPRR